MNTSATLIETSATDQQRRGWIILTIMLLAILEVLDSTIVNVALPSIMASVGANQDQATWILTSYVVASAIVLPITGFLTNLIGRKRFLFICATGFMLSSFACGMSTSLAEIVFFRVLQGMFGASLIPISQTLLRQTFPPEEQGKAMTIWGLGILTAPVLGPTLGGFITEYSTWRWVFYINLPFCILGLILIAWVIPKTEAVRAKIDYLGLFLMIIGVGALQIFLDKGNQYNWFDSNNIIVLCIIASLALLWLVIHCIGHKKPIIHISLYKDRTFALCSLMMLLFCGSVFSFITLQPILLENYFGYSAIAAGLTIAPLGISSAFGMTTSAQLMKVIPVKYILAIALLVGSFGLWHQAQLSLNANQHYFIISNIFIGFGMGLTMVPLSTHVFATLNKKDIGDASGLFSYARMLGTSVGISLISTLVSQMSQVSWHDLMSHIIPFSNNLNAWLQQQNITQITPQTVARLGLVVQQQSGVIAFTDAFKTISIAMLLQIPFALMLKSNKLAQKQE